MITVLSLTTSDSRTVCLNDFAIWVAVNAGKTRSKVIRQALRTYLSERSKLEKLKREIVANITVIYEKAEKKELFYVQHQFGDMITANLHSRLPDESASKFRCKRLS